MMPPAGLDIPFTAEQLAEAAQGIGVTRRWSRVGIDDEAAGIEGPPPVGYVVDYARASSAGTVDVIVVPEDEFGEVPDDLTAEESAGPPFYPEDC